MPTITCSCGWKSTREDEADCWYDWISHDIDMYKKIDRGEHLGSIVEEESNG